MEPQLPNIVGRMAFATPSPCMSQALIYRLRKKSAGLLDATNSIFSPMRGGAHRGPGTGEESLMPATR